MRKLSYFKLNLISNQNPYPKWVLIYFPKSNGGWWASCVLDNQISLIHVEVVTQSRLSSGKPQFLFGNTLSVLPNQPESSS